MSESGTLLRGACISTDITDNIPSEEAISGIKNLGLNCIHLYAECPEFNSPGERVNLVDSIINMAGRDSLYVILTIGGCNQNGQFNLDFIKDFWNFYAPRYADKTYLIFEIVNEPFSWSAPYDSATLAMEKTIYKIIRSHAPQTHILLMSYANAINDTSIIEDLKQLGDSIDWSNSSIAIHGYGTSSEELRHLIHTVKDSGYAITVTEPESIGNVYVNMATTRVMEQETVSYTHFIPVAEIVNNPVVFKSKIESSELRWHPDFGTWPETITEISYINPFHSIEAGFYDEGYGIRHLFPDFSLGYISLNDYAAFYNLDFETGPLLFETICSSAGSGGSIDLHLDSLNGLLVGSCNITSTGDWDTFETFSCTTLEFDGIHDLYLVFRGGQSDLFNLKSFVFKKFHTNSDAPTTLQNDLNIKIYPNPANDYVNITIKDASIIEVYDTQGKLLVKKRLYPENSVIKLNDLSSGLYFLRILSEDRFFSKKLIIE